MPIKPLLAKTMAHLEAVSKRGENVITGQSTGFTDIDSITSGLHPGDLIIFAGRPGMGETILARQMAEHIATYSCLSVAIYSEVSTTNLVKQILASTAQIDKWNLRNKERLNDDWPKLANAVELLKGAPIYIGDTTALTMEVLRDELLQCPELGLVIVDNLRHLALTAPKWHRAATVANILASLRSIAKELNVPIIAIGEIKRSVEEREDKRPYLNDLVDSNLIRHYADMVLTVYREEIYNPESGKKGQGEIIVAKNRNGATGTITQCFNSDVHRFETPPEST